MLDSTSSQQNWRPILILAALALVLTIWQHRAARREAVSLPEGVCRVISYPAMRAFTIVQGVLYDVSVSVLRAPSLAAENRRLRQERDRLEADKILLTEHFLENKRFREKLGFTPEQTVKEIPARVIARPPEGTRVTLDIAGGREVHEGDIVREAAGLVGRIIAVHGSTAEAMLLVDSQHALSGVDQRSRDQGMIYPVETFSGLPRRLRMEKLRRDADLRVGDQVLSSGLDGIYPSGIPIGIIESVQRAPASVEAVTAIIKPFADFSRLDYVWIISNP